LNGTARFSGMSGAFGALGGDFQQLTSTQLELQFMLIMN